MENSVPLPEVAVVLAIHRPDPELLRRLLESLKGQAGVSVRLVAVIDGPQAADRRIMDLVAGAAFRVIENPQNLGIRRAFLAGLEAALGPVGQSPPAFLAFADQDDVWHAEKLRTLVEAARDSGAALAYCDARVVTADGQVVAPSLHRLEARRPARRLLDCVVLNGVSGMTALFTPEVARLALRLAPGLDTATLHDHVVAVAAAAVGRLAFVERSLVDYVQHDGNAMGARPRSGGPRRPPVLRDLPAYRERSRQAFAARRGLVVALADAGYGPASLTRPFRVGSGAITGVLALLGAALAYAARGDGRRSFMCLRLADGAARFRGAPA
jgi:hypothetical protein